MPNWIDYPFDIESLPNVFSAVFTHADSGTTWVFEVSPRVNQSSQFLNFVRTLGQFPECRMVGFNNIGYDYPVIHGLLHFHTFEAADAYAISKRIIDTPWDDRFRNQIRPTQWVAKQVDLFKVWHFDNKARRTSLKQIEIALRMNCVVEFDLDFDSPLPVEKIPGLLAYNMHDVAATHLFWRESRKALAFRDEMTAELGEDMTNQSDSNIGSKVFIHELEKHSPGICGSPGRWRQTPRASIALGDCVFDYVQFGNAEFAEILQQFKSRTITKTKDAFKFEVETLGMIWKFGTGGIHAAKDNRTWRRGGGRVVQARDVKSYYPNLSIRNKVFPEHLSVTFCDVYEALYDKRAATPKSDPRNGALKLALNGTYGNSNSQFSPFYDPKFTMTITINGQLLLCMLSEWLAAVPTLELIQANTDGVMYAVNEEYVGQCDAICGRWEQVTGLVLETDDFSLFAQRDVNNYLARDVKGKLKPKGAFEYQTGLETIGYEQPGDGGQWWKNQSTKIIPIAVEKYMIDGVTPEQTINECENPFWFMNTLKVQRSDRVMMGGTLTKYTDTQSPVDAKTGKHPERTKHIGGEEQQRVGRYYAATTGDYLFKIMSPLRKLPHHERPQAIEKDQIVRMCNDVHHFDWAALDRKYYIEAANELIASTGLHNAH